MSLSKEASSAGDSLSVALIGKTGNGKSSLGNLLLGKPAFTVSSSFKSCTSSCRREAATVNGRQIVVVDTPGTFDTNDKKKGVRKLHKLINYSPNGYHAFLLVLSAADRFTDEQDAAVAVLRRIFSDSFLQFAVIVFTNGDRFRNDVEQLKEALRDAPPSLKELVELCDWRVAIVDNREGSDADQLQQQRLKLVHMVELLSSSGRVYSNEYFELAQKLEEERKRLQAEQESLRQNSASGGGNATKDAGEMSEFGKQALLQLLGTVGQAVVQYGISSIINKPSAPQPKLPSLKEQQRFEFAHALHLFQLMKLMQPKKS